MTRIFAASLERASSVDAWRRFAQLQLGLLFFGVAIALMLRAGIGLDPWSTFHEGVSSRTGLSFGRVTQLVGLALIVIAWLALQVRPGLGTAMNMLVVGPWVNLFRDQPWLPTPDGWLLGSLQFLVGVALLGLASGLYIAARFGAGPRDGFVLGIAGRFGSSIRLSRGALELTVLAAGALLGGPIGLGTVLFALTVGPSMQFFLRLFRYAPAARAATNAAD